MKRILALMLVLITVLSIVACGGGGNAKNIIGSWHITDEDTATEYGVGIEFTKDGKLRYGLTSDAFATFGNMDKDEFEDAMSGLDSLITIEYEVKNNKELEITTKALFGLAKERKTVSYSLNGDTLEFDGVTYKRVK